MRHLINIKGIILQVLAHRIMRLCGTDFLAAKTMDQVAAIDRQKYLGFLLSRDYEDIIISDITNRLTDPQIYLPGLFFSFSRLS